MTFLLKGRWKRRGCLVFVKAYKVWRNSGVENKNYNSLTCTANGAGVKDSFAWQTGRLAGVPIVENGREYCKLNHLQFTNTTSNRTKTSHRSPTSFSFRRFPIFFLILNLLHVLSFCYLPLQSFIRLVSLVSFLQILFLFL